MATKKKFYAVKKVIKQEYLLLGLNVKNRHKVLKEHYLNLFPQRRSSKLFRR